MPKSCVLTLAGPDRVGVVNEITKLVLAYGGNVETSRMARLGGAFAVLMLVTLPEEKLQGLELELKTLTEQGYTTTISHTAAASNEILTGWVPYQLDVQGADHEGIIHRIAHHLSERGISVESLETETTAAPFGAIPLFTMTARVVVPPDLSKSGWQEGLETIADRMNLEIRIVPVEESSTPSSRISSTD